MMNGRGHPVGGPGPTPAQPTPSATPRWLHHDSQWCWAGRARWLETQRDRGTDSASTHKPWPALAPMSHAGPWPGAGLPPPRPDLSRERATGRGGGRGAGVVVARSRSRQGPVPTNPFSCPLLALEGLPGARWQSWPPGWAWWAGTWRPPPWWRWSWWVQVWA